jgi:hypothetical protein
MSNKPEHSARAACRKEKVIRINQEKRSKISSLKTIALFCCGNLLHNGGMKYGYARVSTDGQSIEGFSTTCLTRHFDSGPGHWQTYCYATTSKKRPCGLSLLRQQRD